MVLGPNLLWKIPDYANVDCLLTEKNVVEKTKLGIPSYHN